MSVTEKRPEIGGVAEKKPDADKDLRLREQYKTALKDFMAKLDEIVVKADDPLLKAQALVTIMKCTPKVGDFSELAETLRYIRQRRNQRILVIESIADLTARIKHTSNPRELREISAALGQLEEVFQ